MAKGTAFAVMGKGKTIPVTVFPIPVIIFPSPYAMFFVAVELRDFALHFATLLYVTTAKNV